MSKSVAHHEGQTGVQGFPGHQKHEMTLMMTALFGVTVPDQWVSFSS
jgi:hypothetical protein